MGYKKEFKSFADFYKFYLAQHQHPVCILLHVIGSTLVLLGAVFIIAFMPLYYFAVLPIIGYGFAWIGHFFFEKNRPATFEYPILSFLADWVMLKDFLLGRLKYKED